jgi:beta-glucosidase
MYITENGVSVGDDEARALYLRRHLYVVALALQKGYDIRGYYWWSLMDNWEWFEEGYKAKFGLYEVNFKTQERTLRPSSAVFKDIAAAARPRRKELPAHVCALGFV